MSKERKTINVTLMLPVSVELEVSWDDDVNMCEVHRVSRDMIQSGLDPSEIYELCEDDFDHLNELTRKALGMEAEE